MASIEDVRAAYPVLDQFAYLNAGTNGPLARATVEAMLAEELVDLTQGRGGEPYFSRALGMRDEVRAKLAAHFDVEPAQVALTRSTTDGCNIVLAGLELGPEDEVVTTDVEHFGLIGPLHASGAKIVAAPEDKVVEAVTDRTRLVAISHVSWVTGQLARPGGDQGRDRPAGPRRRRAVGRRAPDSAGRGRLLRRLLPEVAVRPGRDRRARRLASRTSSASRCRATSPRRSISRTAPSLRAKERSDSTAAGSARPPSRGFPLRSTSILTGASSAIAQMAAKCRAALEERFEVVTKPDQAGLVTFRPTSDPTELVEKLRGEGVIVRELPGRNLIRVSCGYWTSDDDLERLLGGLA